MNRSWRGSATGTRSTQLAPFSPLRAAEDAIILDSDKLNADEVFAKVEALCR